MKEDTICSSYDATNKNNLTKAPSSEHNLHEFYRFFSEAAQQLELIVFQLRSEPFPIKSMDMSSNTSTCKGKKY